MKTITKTYDLNELSIIISVKESGMFPNHVESQKFRKAIANPKTGKIMEPVIFSPSELFFEEVEFLIFQCQFTDLNTQALYDASYLICKKHVEQLGRLIDNDLESYLDRIMTVAEAIQLAESGPMIKEEGEKLRDFLRTELLSSLFSSIYDTRRNSLGKAFLVKLSDQFKN